LIEAVTAFKQPVAYVHGDSHYIRWTQKFQIFTFWKSDGKDYSSTRSHQYHRHRARLAAQAATVIAATASRLPLLPQQAAVVLGIGKPVMDSKGVRLVNFIHPAAAAAAAAVLASKIVLWQPQRLCPVGSLKFRVEESLLSSKGT
jgi:hypothetical protein